MIMYCSQVEHAGGIQEIIFYTSTQPSIAVATWLVEVKEPPKKRKRRKKGEPKPPPEPEKDPVYEEVNQTYELTPVADGGYMLYGLIPSNDFNVSIDTEPNIMPFVSDWRQSDFKEAEYTEMVNGWIPYCDLSKVDIQYYTLDDEKLDVWTEYSKWFGYAGPTVEDVYGGPTLVVSIGTADEIWARKGSDDWKLIEEIGGYYYEVIGLDPVIQDPIARMTITRESLYKKRYRSYFS